LINETKYGNLGLFLMPDELSWFPKDKIVPLYGGGLKGRARPRPEKVIAYQLDLMVCPWLRREERTCMIYRHRPTVCRSYPLSENVVHRECRFFASTTEELQEIQVDLASIKEETIADRKCLEYLWRSLGQHQTFWVWPLNERKWILKTKEHAEKAFNDIIEDVLMKKAQAHLTSGP